MHDRLWLLLIICVGVGAYFLGLMQGSRQLTSPDPPAVTTLTEVTNPLPDLTTIDTKPPPPDSPVSLIDPNSADVATLTTLPGVGPVLAKRIVTERETGGPFRRVEDLERVSGIGPKLVTRLRRYLVLTPSNKAP